jgi:hypothetical protein
MLELEKLFLGLSGMAYPPAEPHCGYEDPLLEALYVVAFWLRRYEVYWGNGVCPDLNAEPATEDDASAILGGIEEMS